jgi:hypothetical protein
MDAATKLDLLNRDFGQYAPDGGTVYHPPRYTVPPAVLPHLVRRFAELDIEDLTDIVVVVLGPDGPLYRLDDVEFDVDRSLTRAGPSGR